MSNLDQKLLNNITDSQTTFADDDLFVAWNTSGGYNYQIKIPDVVKDAVQDAGAVQSLQADTISNRPAPGNQNAWFISTDEPAFYRDDGTNWVKVYGTVIGFDEGSSGGQVSSNDTRDARSNTFTGNNTFSSNTSVTNGSILKISGSGGLLEVVDGGNVSSLSATKLSSLIAELSSHVQTNNVRSSSGSDLQLQADTNQFRLIKPDSSSVAIINPSEFQFFTPKLSFQSSNPEILNGSNKVLEMNRSSDSATVLRNNGSTSAFLEMNNNVSNLRNGNNIDMHIGGSLKLAINSTNIDFRQLVKFTFDSPILSSNDTHIAGPTSSSNYFGIRQLLASYKPSTNHSFSQSTWTTVQFNTKETSTKTAPDLNASHQFVAPESGIYKVSGYVTIELKDAHDVFDYQVRVNKNSGGLILGQSNSRYNTGSSISQQFRVQMIFDLFVLLTANDTLEIQAWGSGNNSNNVEVIGETSYWNIEYKPDIN